jgi:hypothetical protein
MLKIYYNYCLFQWAVSLIIGFSINICSKNASVAFSTETTSADFMGDAIT